MHAVCAMPCVSRVRRRYTGWISAGWRGKQNPRPYWRARSALYRLGTGLLRPLPATCRVVVVTVKEAHFVSGDACLLQFFVPAVQMSGLAIQSADVWFALSSDDPPVDLRTPSLADVFCVDQQGKSMLRNHPSITIYFADAISRAW